MPAFSLLVGLLLASAARAQSDTTVYYDKVDLMGIITGKRKTQTVEPVPVKGKLILFVVPAFGSNPSLGAFYGLAGTGAMYLDDPAHTNISSLSTSVLFTTKNQFIASVKGTIMTAKNEWEILTDVRYSDFSENTYGLGSDDNQPVSEDWNLGGIETKSVQGAQPLGFSQLRFHVTPLKQVTGKLYLGIGYHFDSHFHITDHTLNLASPNPVISSHYAYCLQYGFNPDNYQSVGLSLNVVYDDRDHVVSPYRGRFLQLSLRTNSRFMGSSADGQLLYLEARHYVPLSKTIQRHLIGFWGIAHFVTNPLVPYLDLPASGYDMRNRIGRGYVSGRFRGPSWVTVESEYRFPISRNGLFGGVLFANVTSTSRESYANATYGIDIPALGLFESLRPAAGFGARITLNRIGRLNIAMDMAFGQNGSKGFYFAVGETF